MDARNFVGNSMLICGLFVIGIGCHKGIVDGYRGRPFWIALLTGALGVVMAIWSTRI